LISTVKKKQTAAADIKSNYIFSFSFALQEEKKVIVILSLKAEQ
jgi:hypothetical protein